MFQTEEKEAEEETVISPITLGAVLNGDDLMLWMCVFSRAFVVR